MSLTPTELRHTIHKYPELSFQEYNTTKLIRHNIESLENSHKIIIHTPYKTGLLIEYTVNDGDYFLFRADIDALPIKEENEIDFRSTNDFMHACGHDVHTSILYSFLQSILISNIQKNILFLFQPAEESGGGAMEFYETGILNNYKISHAFALHVTDEYPEGTVASTSGVLFASSLEIDLEFQGVSAHVAFPKEGKNAFNALRLFLDKCDISKDENSEPFIFGVGKIYSGEVRNITPGFAKLEGTIRGLSKNKVLEFYSSLLNILNEVQTVTGVDYKIAKGAHYPEVIVNDKLFTQLSNELSKENTFIDCGYKMTGEDFGFFSQKYPSFMLWLGTSNGKKFGLHSSKFLPPDSVIEKGNRIFNTILKTL